MAPVPSWLVWHPQDRAHAGRLTLVLKNELMNSCRGARVRANRGTVTYIGTELGDRPGSQRMRISN